jgi:hypothetical protein
MLYFDRGKTLGMEKFQIFPIFWDKIRFFPKQLFGKTTDFLGSNPIFKEKSDF